MPTSGATHSRLAVCDLNANPLAEATLDIDIADGPDPVLTWVLKTFETSLIAETGRSRTDVRGVGDRRARSRRLPAGRAVHPPIMPGWDDYPIRDRFAERYAVPVLVDNDVNIMALGEYWAMDPKVEDFVFVKVGTGIGSGLILGGHLHRGARGAAGDVGHVQAGPADVMCRCGNPDCLEASAGGAAIARLCGSRATTPSGVATSFLLFRPGITMLSRQSGRLVDLSAPCSLPWSTF